MNRDHTGPDGPALGVMLCAVTLALEGGSGWTVHEYASMKRVLAKASA
jgi:hypothetical protein